MLNQSYQTQDLQLKVNGAKWVILSFTWWSDLSLYEVNEAATVVADIADPEANIIFGAVIDESYSGEIKCTVVATWFNEESQNKEKTVSPQMKRLGGQGLQKSTEDLEVPAFMRKTLK